MLYAKLLLLELATLAAGFIDYGNVVPEYYTIGEAITIDATKPYTGSPLTLSPNNPILTIDYGTEVAGFPFFDVEFLSEPTQVEVKYAESFVSLSHAYSDGPWTFSNGLSDSFRTKTFNLSATGRFESPLLQGGQRWQTIELLTDTTVTFFSVGVRSTAQHLDTNDLAGKFSSSNPIYNDIWNLGARVVQVACVDKGNAPATWEVTDNGVLIEGQQTAQSVRGIDFGNYTLEFSTKIVRGGTGWRVASAVEPLGAVFYLTSNYPESTTYVNTNRSLLPANSLVFDYGWSIVNQSTLETGWTQTFSVNKTIEEDTWYRIGTKLTTAGYEISVDGEEVVFVPSTEASLLAAAPSNSRSSTGSPTDGTFGFGPWTGQSAYVKDVAITARNGSTIYTNTMTSKSVLAEYNVAQLDANVCLDGAKRDRLVWIGDFYHTGKVIGASTNRWDYVIGSIGHSFHSQKTDEPYKGLVPISAYMGTRPEYADAFLSNYAGLQDYQALFLSAIGNYFWSTGDSGGLKEYWPQIKMFVDGILVYVDPYSGLVGSEDAYFFLGPSNGTAVSALFASALKGLVPLATALGDSAAAERHMQTANKLSEAINAKLWNPKLGAYSYSLDAPSNFSVTDMAWAILSGTANSSQASSMIAKIPELRLGVGYRTSSGDVDDPTTQLSPNILGMLLDGLFKANRDLNVTDLSVAQVLFDDFWSKMVTQNEYRSGASWEYLYPDGSPGIDLFTSLAHPWGAAPTYVLPDYVLGVSATAPGFKTWQFQPLLGGLGLSEANGTVKTPYGSIQAQWKLLHGGRAAMVSVTGPKGTTGTLLLPDDVDCEFNGKRRRGGRVEIGSSSKLEVHVYNLQK